MANVSLSMNSVPLEVKRITHLELGFILSLHEPQHNFISIILPRDQLGATRTPEMGSLIPVIVLANPPTATKAFRYSLGW